MVSLPLSLCVCVCVCACVFVRVGGWACACMGGERFSNSNRIIPSDYRILLLLKMPIPNSYMCFLQAGSFSLHKTILDGRAVRLIEIESQFESCDC